MIQPPFTTGTASVTAGSAVVTGTTTAWVLGLVNGGLFTRQGLAVPIASVESDTSLTLSYPWPGATGEGPYAIDLGRSEAASAIVANRRLADVLSGLSRMSALGTEVTAAETGAQVRALIMSTLGADVTGATTPATARFLIKAMQNLDAATSGGAPDNSDWNDFTEPGPIPRLMHSTVAGGNAPRLNQYFYGIVLAFGGNRTQLAFPYLGDQSGAFWRALFGGVWSPWKALTSPTDIGLGNVANKTEAQMVASGAIADALAGADVLVAKYTGAQLSGQTQVILDLPAAFSTFRLLIDSVSGTAGDLTMRCGPAGGALHTGGSDYSVVNIGAITGTGVVSGAGIFSFIGLGGINPNGITQIQSTISDGSGGGFWRAQTLEISQAANGNFNLLHRLGVFGAAGGARKRLGILSSQPFANSGSIKIYGVRP